MSPRAPVPATEATVRIRHRTVVIALAALLALATISLVITVQRPADADHRFSDIATGTFFHEPTAWLADHDIADGYPDGTFRPDTNITRGQAARWFANYNNALVLESGTAEFDASNTHALVTTCGPGRHALSGGGHTNRENLFMTHSRPLGTGWQVRWAFEDAPLDATVTVWALCAPNPLPAS